MISDAEFFRVTLHPQPTLALPTPIEPTGDRPPLSSASTHPHFPTTANEPKRLAASHMTDQEWINASR
jgi:hypothetical protein